MDSIPSNYRATEALADGRRLLLRTIQPDDRETLLREFHRLSADSVRNRFFGVKLDLTPEELEFFTVVDLRNHVALVAELELGGDRQAAGVGRFVRQQDAPDHAEMALTVVDALQGNGIGKILLQHLIACARLLDISYLEATVFADNQRMLHLLRRTGMPVKARTRGSIRTLSLTIE